MNKTIVKNIIKAVNNELDNGLVYVIIETDCHRYNCYEPIYIYDDGDKIAFYDDDDTRIVLHHKSIDSIKIADM